VNDHDVSPNIIEGVNHFRISTRYFCCFFYRARITYSLSVIRAGKPYNRNHSLFDGGHSGYEGAAGVVINDIESGKEYNR